MEVGMGKSLEGTGDWEGRKTFHNTSGHVGRGSPGCAGERGSERIQKERENSGEKISR